MDNYFNFISVLLRSLAVQTGRVMVRSYTGGPRDMALSTRQSVVARSQPPPMMNWKPGKKQFLCLPLPGTHQMTFTIGDETALFYKSLPHRTYCFDGDKPAGSAKRKDRLTLLIITNMDGSDHRKLSVIGKSKTPRCLQKKYKMQVKDMSVDWYASKNAWMTGEIHHQIMSKLNNEMRLSNRHILYVCDNASSHQVREYSHIKFLMLPPNATSIMQPLDQGIILSAKRRYKKKLAEGYLACVENNKDANSLLKALDIVQATNMIAASWRETSSTIIQNCFRKAGFKHHAVDPAPETEDPLPAPAPDVWNRVQRCLGEVQFDEFAASEPEAGTAQPMSDQDIVNIVLTENDAQEESDDESGEEIPSLSAIKTSVEFLAMIDQQKAFLKRNEMPTDIVEQLETQVVAMQFSLCSKQKQMQDYFKSSPRAPTPSKEQRAPTPIKDVSFKTVADATKDVSLVDLLDMDDIELESIDTTIASVAASALMKETPTRFSTPKRSCPPASESPTPVPQPSTSTPTPSQPPAKKMKLNLGLSRPRPKILLSTSQVIHKIINNSSSGSSSACSSIDSDSESASSQE